LTHNGHSSEPSADEGKRRGEDHDLLRGYNYQKSRHGL
jgi:hypothetical protein